MKPEYQLFGILTVYLVLTQVALAADDALEEIVVTASLCSTSVCGSTAKRDSAR